MTKIKAFKDLGNLAQAGLCLMGLTAVLTYAHFQRQNSAIDVGQYTANAQQTHETGNTVPQAGLEHIDSGEQFIDDLLMKNGIYLGTNNPYNVTGQDIDFMIRVVATEVGYSQPKEGIEAVVDVIINRYNSPEFESTIRGVLDSGPIGQKSFSAISYATDAFPESQYDGKFTASQLVGMYPGFSEEYIGNVNDAVLAGLFPSGQSVDITGGATFYGNDAQIAQNYGYGTTLQTLLADQGINVVPTTTAIGDHTFYALASN